MTFKSIGQTAVTAIAESRNAVGSKHGETESALSPSNGSEIAEWLGRQEVRNVDRAAVLRAQSHNVGLAVRTEWRFPSTENGERLPSYQVAVGCEVSGSEADRKAALVELKKFQHPADIRHIEDWLAELSVITASRSREGIEAALTVNAYASRLRKYPADVVRYALLQKTWKWWPTWDELKKVCDAKAGPRVHMLHALSQPIEPEEPERRPPTKEERARVQAMVDEMFPQQSAETRKAAVDKALAGDCMEVRPND